MYCYSLLKSQGHRAEHKCSNDWGIYKINPMKADQGFYEREGNGSTKRKKTNLSEQNYSQQTLPTDALEFRNRPQAI